MGCGGEKLFYRGCGECFESKGIDQHAGEKPLNLSISPQIDMAGVGFRVIYAKIFGISGKNQKILCGSH